MKRGVLNVFMFIIFTSVITAQVKIKEKIEIDPQSGRADIGLFSRGYTPCGPYMENNQPDHYWQVVWAGYYGPLDPAQQLFGKQGGVYFGSFMNLYNGPYDIEIIEGADACKLQEKIHEVDEYGNNFYYWNDLETNLLQNISGT